MLSTPARILRHGIPAALILGCLGIVYAQFAGVWFQNKIGEREAPSGGAEVTDALQWRMPLAMAGWGFGVVAAIELVTGLWRKPIPSEAIKPVPDAEELLSKLLDEAEAAERERDLRSPKA